jgi:hypothetical protein
MNEFCSFARLAFEACPDGLNEMARRIVAVADTSTPPSVRQDWWCERVMTPITSIQSSHETLRDLHFYVGQYPYEGTRISPMRHLRFNVQSYFQEVYVLRQRLIDLLNIAKKDFGSRDDGPTVAQTCDRLCRELKARIKTVIEKRGEHVHQWGFETYSFTWLDAIELSLTANIESLDPDAAQEFQAFFDEKYPAERQLWSDAIEEANGVIENVIDDCARELNPMFFDASGKLRFAIEIAA